MKIKLIWGEKREARRRLQEAEQEVKISRERYNDYRSGTAADLHNLQDQNHFAQLLAESLIKGYSK
jgi:hypothetical protein